MIHRVNATLQPLHMNTATTSPALHVKEPDTSFANTLKNALEIVNEKQIESDVKTNMLIAGKDIDLHEVMIAAQKASITLETSVQIQKKMLDAYNEVMRMQI